MCYIVFFFQAEDGIRDLVRSRGLGDVYKRQLHAFQFGATLDMLIFMRVLGLQTRALKQAALAAPVSYTHLTLPTSDLV